MIRRDWSKGRLNTVVDRLACLVLEWWGTQWRKGGRCWKRREAQPELEGASDTYSDTMGGKTTGEDRSPWADLETPCVAVAPPGGEAAGRAVGGPRSTEHLNLGEMAGHRVVLGTGCGGDL